MRWLLPLLTLLWACPSPSTPEPAVEDDGVVVAYGAEPLHLGDWTRYPAPVGQEWPVRTLDDERWMKVTAELACASRGSRGNPDAHRASSDAILQAHETSAAAVMAFGVQVNAEPDRAFKLGGQVAATIEVCR